MKKTITVLLVSITVIYTGNAQIQKGNDIDGAEVEDRSGWSVSMPDKNTVAIGAFLNDGSGSEAGHVRIFRWNGSLWEQKGSDINGEAADDQSGWAISMPDSNTVAIGANQSDGSAGHVRIYRWNGSLWVQKGSDIDGETAGSSSGWSVSMPDSNTVAIGAPSNSDAGVSAGHVRIYRWNGSAWVQKGFEINGEAGHDQLGYSVSMPDNNTVAIGATRNFGAGSSSGHVRIYSWNGSAWVQKGIDINGEAINDQLGQSVSMPDSNTLAIGAITNGANGMNSGHVRIFRWNGSAWAQKGFDIYGEAAEDESGYSLSMPDSNTVAIGGVNNDGSGNNAGHVRIYTWNTIEWIQHGIDIDGETADDLSGWSVSMPDNNTVAVGSFRNAGNGIEAGHTRVYSFCPPSASSFSVTSCGSYTWPLNGVTYTSSTNTATVTYSNASGCDSVVTLNLTINTVNTYLTATLPTLTANAVGADYQWLDCANSFVVIPSEINQSFTVTANGSYAVEVTQNGCTDTSACEAITNMGILENSFGTMLTVYPNPTNGELSIDLGSSYNNVTLIASNELGQIVHNQNFSNSSLLQFNIRGKAGVYFIEVRSNDKKARLKVIKIPS